MGLWAQGHLQAPKPLVCQQDGLKILVTVSRRGGAAVELLQAWPSVDRGDIEVGEVSF